MKTHIDSDRKLVVDASLSVPDSDILHPVNRDWLKGLLQKGRDDRDAGRMHDATPEFFDSIIRQGLERLTAKNNEAYPLARLVPGNQSNG